MKARLCALFKGEEEYQILKEQKGKELVGIKYVPMFDFFLKEYGEIAYKVFFFSLSFFSFVLSWANLNRLSLILMSPLNQVLVLYTKPLVSEKTITEFV